VIAVALAPAELVTALARAGGNVAKCARTLGVTGKAVRCALARAGVSARAVRDLEVSPFVAPERPRRTRKPRGRVLAVGSCDAARQRSVAGTDNASGCDRRAVAFGVPEVTEIVVRNVAIDLPVVTVNAYREHWGQRQRRRAKIHRVIKEALGAEWAPPELPAGWRWLVTFTRYSRLRLDDDNATASFKPHRDAVADLLRLDDRDRLVTFRVCQTKWNERATVKRWDRVSKRQVLAPGFRCFFRVRIEQVKASEAVDSYY